MTSNQRPTSSTPIRERATKILIPLGVLLILVGYFSPWIPHRAVGLAMTGYEIAEWLKFAPEIRSGAAPVHVANFYWPPIVAAIGLTVLAARDRRWGWSDWLLVALGALFSLLPFPILEEVRNWAGIRGNLARLGLMSAGLAAAALASWRRKLPSVLRGGVLLLVAGLGVGLVTTAFSAAVPVVARLFNQPIDAGTGYQLTRAGMLLLCLAGLVELADSAR